MKKLSRNPNRMILPEQMFIVNKYSENSNKFIPYIDFVEVLFCGELYFYKIRSCLN